LPPLTVIRTWTGPQRVWATDPSYVCPFVTPAEKEVADDARGVDDEFVGQLSRKASPAAVPVTAMTMRRTPTP
jgi:hypothetical protein